MSNILGNSIGEDQPLPWPLPAEPVTVSMNVSYTQCQPAGMIQGPNQRDSQLKICRSSSRVPLMSLETESIHHCVRTSWSVIS